MLTYVATHRVLIVAVLFGASFAAALAANFLIIAMIDELNRRQDSRSQLSWHFSPVKVLQEYVRAFPQGKYAKATIAFVCLSVVLGLGFMSVLF